MKKVFNAKDFDRKIAIITHSIHFRASQRKKENDFIDWVNNNIDSLDNMYELSGLECDTEKFYEYAFESTN